ncbi:MAG: fumarylacetoacetate hydrolase family protein [Candidatus Binatia bacterium]
MIIAIFDGFRMGVVEGEEIVDVTDGLPHYDPGFSANFWVRMCQGFETIRSTFEILAREGQRKSLSQVHLEAPILNPSKIIAAAANYAAHVTEMRKRSGTQSWLNQFGVFLKAPSSIIGPGEPLILPNVPGREIHHESELALVIGKGGKHISEADAMDHVLGYTIAIDVTVRGEGDRSRRKSYDGFTPVGPWLVTADEISNPHDLDIKLWVDGDLKQEVNSSGMLVKIPAMIAYASDVMTLYPGDLISTGAPPGVGEIHPGETMVVEISKIGRLEIPIAGKKPKASPPV